MESHKVHGPNHQPGIVSKVLIINLQEILFLFVSGVKVHTVHLSRAALFKIELDGFPGKLQIKDDYKQHETTSS
jgi:hypothetical protein